MIHTSARVAGRRARAITIAAAIGAALLLPSLGGCTVTHARHEPASAKVKDVLDSGRGRFDLTRPPSRDEAGLPAGRTDVTYQRDDHHPFQVQVVLPGGKQLDVQARLLTFDALGGSDPRTAPPTTLDIHSYPQGPAAGRDQLMAAAKDFGLDTGLIAKWYDETQAPRPNQAPPTVDSPWLTATVGYLRLDVRGSYSPPADAKDAGQTVVHYTLTWRPEPAAARS